MHAEVMILRFESDDVAANPCREFAEESRRKGRTNRLCLSFRESRLTVGRLGAIAGPAITGTLVSAGNAYPMGFYVFAVVAVLALVALTIMPAAIYDPSREDA